MRWLSILLVLVRPPANTSFRPTCHVARPPRRRIQRRPARPTTSLSYTAGERTFDWGQLVKEDRGLEWVRLRALLGDADTRRPPFFARRAGQAPRDALEALAAAALEHVALRRGDAASRAIRERARAVKVESASDPDAQAFCDAVDAVLTGNTALLPATTPPRGACGEAYAKFAAEIESAREDVDFCLSLPDRRRGAPDQLVVELAPMTATRALNDASNALLRAAAYGDRAAVEEVRVGLVALSAELNGLDGYLPDACDAYLDRLQALATAEGEYSPERAEVEDAAFATFYAEGAARAPAAALGDAYAVALQRFLGELTRRGAIAGQAPVFEDESGEDYPSTLGNANPLVSRLLSGWDVGFAEWEMKLRRKLSATRDPSLDDLHPQDFVGVWRVTLVDEAVANAGGPLITYDTPMDSSQRPVAVVFEDDGSVRMDAPAPSALKLRPPRWRVRAGPAHLDTCEFEVDVAGGRVAFCGYVDRGQRISARFSASPILVSGFAFEKGDSPRRLDSDARPSGQFRMSGPARDKEE
jgi:hypothetical protein